MFLYANFFSVSGVYGLFQLCIKYIDRKKRKGKFKCHVNVYLPLILRTCAVGTKKLSIRRNVVIIASCVLHLDLIIKDDDKREVNYQWTLVLIKKSKDFHLWFVLLGLKTSSENNP